MLKLMMITGDPGLAAFATACGVQRIFVDLEINGKFERQGHRDTLISHHTMADVARVRASIKGHQLLVRLNPDYAGSEAEIEAAIAAGADILMLPMFTDLSAIRHFTKLINGRCKFIPLIETPAAAMLVPELVREPGIDELFVGLNDLHMALGLDFMFELLADGTVERIAACCRNAGMAFGFGGIARMEEGHLPGKQVLAEHIRLGSSSVILSRTFHRASTNLDELMTNFDFKREVEILRDYEKQLARSSAERDTANHQALLTAIISVRDAIRASKPR